MLITTDHVGTYAHDDGAVAITVRRTADRGDRGASIWSWAIFTEGRLLASGCDLSGWGDSRGMLDSLLTFLALIVSKYM